MERRENEEERVRKEIECKREGNERKKCKYTI